MGVPCAPYMSQNRMSPGNFVLASKQLGVL